MFGTVHFLITWAGARFENDVSAGAAEAKMAEVRRTARVQIAEGNMIIRKRVRFKKIKKGKGKIRETSGMANNGRGLKKASRPCVCLYI